MATSAQSALDPWRQLDGFNGYTWPIRRVTFQQPDRLADGTRRWPSTMFSGNDDLAYDFPQRDDRPAMQNWDTANINSTPTPLARQWTGDYSWMVTVAPTTNAARDGMARNPGRIRLRRFRRRVL